MGNCAGGFGRIKKTWFNEGASILPWIKPKPIVIAVIGQESVGKTTIIKAIQGDDFSHVISTVGFARETLEVKRKQVIAYDLGGSEHIRDIWKNYFGEVFGIVYVIDSADKVKLETDRGILNSFASYPELHKKPLLIVLNKQDLPDAIDELEFSNAFKLHTLSKQLDVRIRIENVVATRGTGELIDPRIIDAFSWITDVITAKYSELEVGVQHAMAQLKERQEQERVNRQHRLAKLQAQKTNDSPNASRIASPQSNFEESETRPSSQQAGTARESTDVVQNGTDVKIEQPRARKQRTEHPSFSNYGALENAIDYINGDPEGIFEPQTRIQRVLKYLKSNKVAPIDVSFNVARNEATIGNEASQVAAGHDNHAFQHEENSQPMPEESADTDAPAPVLTRHSDSVASRRELVISTWTAPPEWERPRTEDDSDEKVHNV